jgi:WD40 repeat protein
VAAIALSLAFAAGAVWRSSQRPHDTSRYRFTPMEVSWENPLDPVWSPDGKAFAYDAEVAGVRQVFLRYLNSPTPVQLTQGSTDATAVGWSGDGKRFISGGKNPQTKELGHVLFDALFSIPVFGGEPELLLTADIDYAVISSDGKALAAIIEEDGKMVVKTSSPVGAPFQRYAPAPFETKESSQEPNLRFSPDGRRILLLFDQLQGRLAWKLPWPPGRRDSPAGAPYGCLLTGRLPSSPGFPTAAISFSRLRNKQDDDHQHLWIADVDSGARRPITSSASSEMEPALSPDGKKLCSSNSIKTARSYPFP